jgi:hypothetical protein
MHIGQAAHAFSDLFSLPLSRVQSTCRYLREAGFVRSGARGVNAPHLADIEVVRILIALMATESPRDAVERCQYFASLPVEPSRCRMSAEKAETFKGRTVEDVLSALLKGMREGSIKRQSEGKTARELKAADFTALGGASLELNVSLGTVDLMEEPNGYGLHFTNDLSVYELTIDNIVEPPFWSQMSRITRISHTTLMDVANLAATDSSTEESEKT